MRSEQHRQSHPSRMLVTLAVTGLMANGSAWAGARVGSPVGTASTASTTVYAPVISSTPVVAQVATPRQFCHDEIQVTQAQPSGAGAILGAIAGAAVGNAIGGGSGRALATGVGLIGGAVLGNHIETDGRPTGQRTVRRCENQTAYENQVVAHEVVYEFNGQRYSTQMPKDPGATIPIQITLSPVQSSAPSVSYQGAPVAQTQVLQSGVVMVHEDRPYRPYRPHRHHHWD